MIDAGIVQGSAAQAKPVVIGDDTVYVHTNITPVLQDTDGNPIAEGEMYSYREYQYTKDEYILLMWQKIEEHEQRLQSLQTLAKVGDV